MFQAKNKLDSKYYTIAKLIWLLFGLSRIQMTMVFDTWPPVKFDTHPLPKKKLLSWLECPDYHPHRETSLKKISQIDIPMVLPCWQRWGKAEWWLSAGCGRRRLCTTDLDWQDAGEKTWKETWKGSILSFNPIFSTLKLFSKSFFPGPGFWKEKSGLPHHLTRFRLNRSALCMHVLVRGRNFGENLCETCSFYLVRIYNVFSVPKYAFVS